MHYRTDVRVRVDAMALESLSSGTRGIVTREVLAERIARMLEDLGLSLYQGIDVTIIERNGTMAGRRATAKIPKFRR
jgi:hypothetical protein